MYNPSNMNQCFLFLLTILLLNNFNISNKIFKLPNCSNCKWFVNNISNINHGKCTMFGEKIKEKLMYNYAKHCRENEKLCGQNGHLFEEDEEKKEQEQSFNSFNQQSKPITQIDHLKETNKELYDYTQFLQKRKE